MVNYKVTLVCPLWRRLQVDGQDFFTSYDEVYESFDAMGLQENLLRGIYAYGECNSAVFYLQILTKTYLLFLFSMFL